MVRWKYDKMISWELMIRWVCDDIHIHTDSIYILGHYKIWAFKTFQIHWRGLPRTCCATHTTGAMPIIRIIIIIILTMMIFRWQWCPGRHWGASIRGRETPWHGNIYITYWGSGRKVCPNHDHDYQPRGWKGLSTKLWSWKIFTMDSFSNFELTN